MKLKICKSKDGRYYTKLKNDYNGVKSEMTIAVNVPKKYNLEYGWYNVDIMLSCYTYNGEVRPAIVVLNVKDYEKEEEKMNAWLDGSNVKEEIYDEEDFENLF